MISPYQGSEESIRNNDSLGIGSSDVGAISDEGRSHISLAKTEEFLDFDLTNFKSNSWIIMIHLEYFHPKNWGEEM